MIIAGRTFSDIDSALSFFGYTYQEILDIALRLGVTPELALNYTLTGDVRQSDSDIYADNIEKNIKSLGGATRTLHKSMLYDARLLEKVQDEYSIGGIASAINVLPKCMASAIYSYYASKLLDRYIETFSLLSEQLKSYGERLQCIEVADVRSRTTLLNLVDSIHNQLVSNEKMLDRLLNLRASSINYYRKYENRREVRYCINQIEFNDNDRQKILKWVRYKRFKGIAISTNITKSQNILNKVIRTLQFA